jgi:hypothetical protein
MISPTRVASASNDLATQRPMMSRSETIPTSRLFSSTGTAPTRRSVM